MSLRCWESIDRTVVTYDVGGWSPQVVVDAVGLMQAPAGVSIEQWLAVHVLDEMAPFLWLHMPCHDEPAA